MRISGSTPKQHYEKGAYWRSSFHHSHCRFPCWQHGVAFTVAKFLTVIFCSVGRMPTVIRGNEFMAALKSLYDCVSQSLHAARVPRSFSSLLRHCRMVAPSFPTKHPSKDNRATCKSQVTLQKTSTKIFPAKSSFCTSSLTIKQIASVG